MGLWVTGHPTAMALLQRIMPTGLLVYLDSEDEVPADDVDRLNIRDNLKVGQMLGTNTSILYGRQINISLESVYIYIYRQGV